jgi:hypothetical protein
VKVEQSDYTVRVELTLAELRVLLDELLDVPGGSRRPKIRQLCHALEVQLKLRNGGFDGCGREAEARLRRRKEIA